MGRKKTANDEESRPVAVGGKLKKKTVVIDDDEYSIGNELSVGQPIQKENQLDKVDDDVLERKNNYTEKVDDENSFALSAFTGKKKSSKSTKKRSNLFSADLLDEVDEIVASVSEKDTATKPADDSIGGILDEEDALVISFSGKKKSSKKKNINGFTSLSNEAGGLKEETVEVVESEVATNVGANNQEADNGLKLCNQENEVVECSKNKKKKKKGGRTAQDDDDLDKIIAEFDGGPSKDSSIPFVDEKVRVHSDIVATVEKDGVVETAAAKKNRKKKEKEKEKKDASALAATELNEQKLEQKKNEGKSKAQEKKIPKHVREMQEALARRMEAEERMKREEEERLKKEEEELLRQEELARQAEEVKRRKKEKEKEKLLKKKQEGRFFTSKQREEAKRLEAMRNQILANAAGLPISGGDDASAPTKRPKYVTKKSKAPSTQLINVENVETILEATSEGAFLELEKNNEIESVNVDEKSEVADVIEESGVEESAFDDEDDWDAKSFDDAILTLPEKSAFDEELELEPEPLVKKELRNVQHASGGPPLESQSDESKKDQPEVVGKKKNKAKESILSEAPPKHADGDNLRSPICCIMGHVDTGKTKLLDCIRGTNVQEGEAGGITQQIGATYFPAENIRDRTKELKADAKLKVPGLLVIDTPGHESFNNLRSRGSGLCDIAILVVDIMHGLEPQTIESLNLIKAKNTDFIIALNKVDRLYGWKVSRNAPIVTTMKQQSKDVQSEFSTRLIRIVTQFKEQGLNTELYYKKRELGGSYNIVPTSAVTGEGIPDLLLLLVQWTQKTMVEKLTFTDEVQCTVLEVKVTEGHGTTIDVVLVNGVLHEGDRIVVCGMQGPIVSTIRALLTPHPMKELRIKGTYVHHKQIKAAQGIKITGQNFEHAVAGTGLYVVESDDCLEDKKELAMEDMKSVLSRIDRSGEGVYVQASSLGSLEALLEFLKSPEVKIPVSGIGIGPVHKKDVMKASVMLEKNKEFATILAFDVKVTPEARDLADEVGVKIFIADIIYHLFDQFKAYIGNLKEEKKKEVAGDAVFPCILQIIPTCIFNKKDPIVLGVVVLQGIVKVGTPICVPQKDFIDIGRIASIEFNHKPVDSARNGQNVAIKIVGSNSEEQQKLFGRHFEADDELVSHITRKSIDILKANYRSDLVNDDWDLLRRLKMLFSIQ